MDARPVVPDHLYPEAIIQPGRKFLVLSEIADFMIPDGPAGRWPPLIPLDGEPVIVSYAQVVKDWNIRSDLREEAYVHLRGIQSNGWGEWIHIPRSRASSVQVYAVETRVTSTPLLEGE